MDQMDYQTISEEDLCRYCGERPIDRSTGNPEEYLCKECREAKLKLRVPKWLIAALVAACVANVVMIGYLCTKLGKYNMGKQTLDAGVVSLREASELVAENKQWSALVKIQEYLDENPENADVALEGMRIAMNSGLYDSAAYFFNTYLVEKGFTEDELYEINGYVDKITRFYDTYDAASDIISGMNDLSSDMSTEEINSAMDGMKKDLLRLEADEAYEKEFIEFYISSYFAYDARDAEERMKKATGYPPLAAEAYGRLAIVNRNRGDFEAAEELIKKGEAVNGEMPELVRARATVMLAKGEYEAALPIAEDLYATNPDAMYVLDTYAVALYANGETEKLAKLMESADEGYFDDDFYQLTSGKISVRDYYVKGEE
ncbi:MAG: hypothetical protein K5858_04290 [Lachnospiraceae bacterium]|nr:hypothetical protein [Lachnospiraceae bacterium]